MKRFLIVLTALILGYLAYDTARYYLGWYIDLQPDAPVSAFMSTDAQHLYMDRGAGPEEFTVKGVNLGVGVPGEWATDYAVSKETYLRWFAQMQEMGANTVRVYITLHDDFYNAFYEYNTAREEANEEPLWLIHGVWVNDYIQNSHRDAYDKDFLETFVRDGRTLVDVLHGNKKISLGRGTGSGFYNKDVSRWVIGYILGVEWEDVTVTYTNHKYPDLPPYQGTYLSATEDASAFESMLAQVGDRIVSYESRRYKTQRLVAFSNWPTTDPFLYPEDITTFFMKCAQVDVEHIRTEDAFLAGQFASYHVYPYYPDYLNYILNPATMDRTPIWDGKAVISRAETGPGTPIGSVLRRSDFYDETGAANTYLAYLRALRRHHTMPVVISEFGVSTGRGMAQIDRNTGRNQGHMSEQEQGQALVDCWRDITAANCAGGCVFTWQDEWFKRTWNTMHAVNLQRTPYWSDYQTNEQYFGLLSFDPGAEECIAYVDGDLSEWTEEDKLFDTGTRALSMKYDEKFIYLLAYEKGFANGQKTLYIPIDTTPKTGSTYCENFGLRFEDPVDFVLAIDGRDNSRLLVQERYEVLRAMFYHETHDADAYLDPPDADTPLFKPIELMLQTATPLLTGNWQASSETYETGDLAYGNANPAALERLCVRRPELTRSYLTALNGVTIALAEDYCRRDEIEAAYFPYIIRKYRLLDGQENEALKTMLLDLLHESSIYCRENAMQALYTAGDPAVLVRALRIIDASSLYYHSKLLSDGLLNYTGDTWELADALWEAFDAFQPWMQVTLLNYFRFSSGAYCEKIHALLNDPAQDDEVRFACLRYLGRYPYPPAYADLLRYATPSENARWEYAAIASSVLASYPGAETAAVLERNLYHPNWYIRFNASKSLEQLGFGYRNLIDVIEGNDRYASEILRYRFDVRELEERKEDAVCTTV